MTGKLKERVRIVLFIILLLVILLSIPMAHCQDLPMPPLTVKTQAACHIVEHGWANTLDARTGLLVETWHYRAEPSATTKGKTWTLPKEVMPHSNVQRPGALGDFANLEAAVKACHDWLDAVRAEQEKLLIAERAR